MHAVLRGGWLNPHVGVLTRAFIIPGLMLAAVAILWPLVVARAVLAYCGVGWGAVVAVGAEMMPPREVTLIYRSAFPPLH